MFANTKALAIPEGEVVKVECNSVVLWEKPSSIKNWVQYSLESDGKTIYNGGLGYKEGYRLRSSGVEAEYAGIVCTGFIPFIKGDVLRISPRFTGLNTANTLNYYDSTFTHLGQVTDTGSGYGICNTAALVALYRSTVVNGVSVVTYTDEFDSRIAYIRIGNDLAAMGGSGANMVVTKNEEIPA